MTVPYRSLSADTPFSEIDLPDRPFVALIIDPKGQTAKTQSALSHALLQAGCVSMGAWGPNSTTWDDAGDYACIMNPDGTLKEPQADMDTWWIDDETLDEALAFLMLQAKMLPAQPIILEFGTTLSHPSTPPQP